MRTVILNAPAPEGGQTDRLARLTRHLAARLADFGPGGPEVLSRDEAAGLVRARFPGRNTSAILEDLARSWGVLAAGEGDQALFYLRDDTRFEDLDYLWGSLFQLLG